MEATYKRHTHEGIPYRIKVIQKGDHVLLEKYFILRYKVMNTNVVRRFKWGYYQREAFALPLSVYMAISARLTKQNP